METNTACPAPLVQQAAREAFAVYDAWRWEIQQEGQRAIAYAREHGKKIIVLAGRPYHIDPEINHGIDKLMTSFDLVLVTEDAVAGLGDVGKVHVLNQWTYHSRLYNAADYVTTHPIWNWCRLFRLDAELTRLPLTRCARFWNPKENYIRSLRLTKLTTSARLRSESAACWRRSGEKEAQQKHELKDGEREYPKWQKSSEIKRAESCLPKR